MITILKKCFFFILVALSFSAGHLCGFYLLISITLILYLFIFFNSVYVAYLISCLVVTYFVPMVFVCSCTSGWIIGE